MSEPPVSKQEMKKAADRLATAARPEPNITARLTIRYYTRGEMHPDKKYASLTIALEFLLKREFEAICRKQERSPSSVARKLIAEYVKANLKQNEEQVEADVPEWQSDDT
jgi:predicted transcriptional regulator